eukprot:CAMPEP_0206528000 /NCGR_PEP_ID=MMETSP0325_2-20121206/1692_1 /ASSEMBLY_ACC=CAM_ASM_000347 /TAXON_ID=2866 /ORGANISM="Crypthecodinium cohnii, Strain Seligo" /LENGTH=189 /DNA_ID=CAMNT_0054023535 /DNA_START=259 /DNA_END=828 /DNA_ORIENTATION=-
MRGAPLGEGSAKTCLSAAPFVHLSQGPKSGVPWPILGIEDPAAHVAPAVTVAAGVEEAQEVGGAAFVAVLALGEKAEVLQDAFFTLGEKAEVLQDASSGSTGGGSGSERADRGLPLAPEMATSKASRCLNAGKSLKSIEALSTRPSFASDQGSWWLAAGTALACLVGGSGPRNGSFFGGSFRLFASRSA